MYTFIKRVLNIPFVKFVITAGINTCFGYCTYAICLHLFKQNINLSVVVSTVINILFNFKTYSKIVFKSNDNSRIFKFFGIYATTTTIQILLLHLLENQGIKNPYLSGGLLIVPMALLSFILMKKFVFNK